MPCSRDKNDVLFSIPLKCFSGVEGRETGGAEDPLQHRAHQGQGGEAPPRLQQRPEPGMETFELWSKSTVESMCSAGFWLVFHFFVVANQEPDWLIDPTLDSDYNS